MRRHRSTLVVVAICVLALVLAPAAASGEIVVPDGYLVTEIAYGLNGPEGMIALGGSKGKKKPK